MSYGIVVCSICKREMHQDGDNHTWRHCEDKTPRCVGAYLIYPRPYDLKNIVGKWCGCDE